MDRSVTHRPGFAFSVSMYSDRIRNFESINGENLKGWFTASGATYLYNDDLNQYLEHYWPTVDKQRIAGTTVLKNSSEVNAAFGDAFAGGVEMDGRYGVNAMQYRAPQTKDGSPGGLEAKKAWFVLDDSIVCLGADIDSSIAGAEAETIVDNRKVDDLAGRLTVNGTQMSGVQTKSFQNPAWAHLKGNTPDTVQTHSTDIGYYFPQGGVLTAKQESRTGLLAEHCKQREYQFIHKELCLPGFLPRGQTGGCRVCLCHCAGQNCGGDGCLCRESRVFHFGEYQCASGCAKE